MYFNVTRFNTPRLPTLLLSAIIVTLTYSSAVQAQQPKRPECIAPAKPGGGFDLTCKIAQSAFLDSKALKAPMRVTYMPGGIGAVAYNAMVNQRSSDGQVITAFSGGSLLNLAQGKFGKYNAKDVKWLAAVGTDYGVIAVAEKSPYKSLKELTVALKNDPKKVVFGAGGTVGGQDWMKSALIAQKAGINYKDMRYVAFEGGGEALTALLGNHVQAISGDAGEMASMLASGKIRILAVLADKRLPGAMAAVPTAKEQGFDVSWPIIRGFYLPPKVTAQEYQWWEQNFKTIMATPEFAKLVEQRGLFPFDLTGDKLDAYVQTEVARYGVLAKEFGLVN